jgi:hypothetical protein
VTAPELGLSDHRLSRDHALLSPPWLPLYGRWERAGGRVARFSFSPRLFEAVADEVGLPRPGLKRFWHAFLSIDRRLDALPAVVRSLSTMQRSTSVCFSAAQLGA